MVGGGQVDGVDGRVGDHHAVGGDIATAATRYAALAAPGAAVVVAASADGAAAAGTDEAVYAGGAVTANERGAVVQRPLQLPCHPSATGAAMAAATVGPGTVGPAIMAAADATEGRCCAPPGSSEKPIFFVPGLRKAAC